MVFWKVCFINVFSLPYENTWFSCIIKTTFPFRYDFKNAEKVKLREMGPRFTLKLRSLQKGTFDSKTGEYDWIISGRRHDMETSRRRFFL